MNCTTIWDPSYQYERLQSPKTDSLSFMSLFGLTLFNSSLLVIIKMCLPVLCSPMLSIWTAHNPMQLFHLVSGLCQHLEICQASIWLLLEERKEVLTTIVLIIMSTSIIWRWILRISSTSIWWIMILPMLLVKSDKFWSHWFWLTPMKSVKQHLDVGQ